jgi:hypothetical protein
VSKVVTSVGRGEEGKKDEEVTFFAAAPHEEVE